MKASNMEYNLNMCSQLNDFIVAEQNLKSVSDLS